TAPHSYIKFDHNTIFNQMGRHGTFQFGDVNTVVVTNNFMSNPTMQGTTPFLADEQTQVDNNSIKVFTINGENVTTDFTFSNNNIFWTQDVLDYYATNDTVSKVEVYSQEIVKALGGEAAAEATYFSEPLDLNSVPQRLLPLLNDWYADPGSTTMFDIIVENISRAGTAYDSGNLFDFSTFDAGYSPESQSAKGDTEGKSVGAVPVIATGISSLDVDLNGFKVYPNPASDYLTFEYNVTKAGYVKMSLYDIAGREQLVLVNEEQPAGQMKINFSIPGSRLSPGIYMVQLITEIDRTTKKLILR
ncbi:MAG: T9SS type A sorting domain-containing protein, partial [Bacteroidales bacterium]